MKKAVLSLSGGMDSSTLLLHLLGKGYEVTALSFYYGQKHQAELDKATELCQYLASKECKVKHHIIALNGLGSLLNSTLVEGGAEVPEGHYEEENMKDTVVPNRNKIFSSIIQAAALSLQEDGVKVVIAMGIHAGDHAIYPDCRQEFRDADYKAFIEGNWDAEKIEYYTPYLDTDKAGILMDGMHMCEQLDLDFDEVYSRTLTSYKPIQIEGVWYSDYKSASSVERVEAFIAVDRADPALYANKISPVPWDFVKEQVEIILKENKDAKDAN